MRRDAVTSGAIDHRPAPASAAAVRVTRYPRGAIVLHRLIAALVRSTTSLPIGAAMQPPPPPPKSAAAQTATDVHKTVGFGVFGIPFPPVPRGWPSAAAARFVHVNLAWVMVGLATLHIVAALKHHLVDRDDVLRRMLQGRS